MSNQYIKQINNQNFVFPNSDLAEYDVNIIHTINDNSVTGTVNSLTNIIASSASLQFLCDLTWNKNNADIFRGSNGLLNIASFHLLTPNSQYFKPWRCVIQKQWNVITATTVSTTFSFSVTPSLLQEPNFVSGIYTFDVRFIGGNSTYPVKQTLNITIP